MNREELLDKVRSEVNPIYYDEGMLNLYELAKAQNIRLYESDFKDDGISGFLAKESGNWSIYVNKNHHINRQRFTIAHELGHYFAYKHNSPAIKEYLDRHNIIADRWVVYRQQKPVEDVGKKEMETEANMIAAEILMPKEAVEDLVNKKTDIDLMAITFGVSESAMSYRLKNLGYQPLELFYAPF